MQTIGYMTGKHGGGELMAASEAPPSAGSGGASGAGSGRAGQAEPNHGLRIFLIWLVVALAADLVIWFVWGPHLPPGDMASAANGQQFDIRVMAVMAAPVMALVLVYGAYAMIVWRHREGDDTDGPPIHGNTRIQATWITVTSVIVLCLAGFGTYELVNGQGAGAGEGPTAIWHPTGTKPLQVQVIGQQWRFTYRYPQFGGFETTQLVLPVEQVGPVQRDLAGRHPQLLGLPARREGRRQPRRQQHRLHQAHLVRPVRRPLCRAVRSLARRHVQLRPGRLRLGVHEPGPARPGPSWPA